MTESSTRQLITAREAEAWIPPLDKFASNYKTAAKLLEWRTRPLENDGNLLVVGDPGTGKTSLILAYLRVQFNNPDFFGSDVEDKRKWDHDPSLTEGDARFWQTRSGKIYAFNLIDGATDSEADMKRKIHEIRFCETFHKVMAIDELGELFFRGLDEMLRPMLTDRSITTYATAQNFHSKRRAGSSKAEDQRLSALLRRFSHRESTENPSEADHLRRLAYLVNAWNLKLDDPSTLRLLVEKAGGVVGFSKRALISAIDEPGRRLTRELVERIDVDPLG